QLGHPGAALAVLLERAARPEQFRAVARIHEGETLAFDERLRDRLAVELDQLRLVIEQLELARASGHEKIDDVLRLRRKMSRMRRHRIWQRRWRGSEEPALVKQRGERDAAEPHRATAEEMAAREMTEMRRGIEGRTGRHGYSRVMVSSRLRRTRA